MTERLYYTDATLTRFRATVTSVRRGDDGRTFVTLDRTAFYPTSGGQPFDTGTLGDASVVDVFDDESGEVVHVIEGACAEGGVVGCEIAWPRRFDHMQQHTGQHVLSAAFVETVGVATVSFHMGSEVSTIDLAREVSAAEVSRAEDAANHVVWDDRALVVRLVDAEEAARLPLRKETARVGSIRIVEVPDCDLSACGGTHVARTGQVGAVVVTATERFKGGTRVSFACGGRALRSHRRFRDVTVAACRVLSAGADELTTQAERVVLESKAREKRLTELAGELAVYRAADRRASAESFGAFRAIVAEESTSDAAALKQLAQAIVAGQQGLIVVLAGEGTPVPVVAARAEGTAFDAGAFIKQLTSALGGRGGGRPELAQGGVTAEVGAVLDFARAALRS